MNNERVARLFLSAIIGKEVVALEFRPTEHHFPEGELPAVLRMDFSARMQDAEGNQELVIIEVQKAKMAGDIMRFRRYVGEQYANKENVVREPSAEYPHRKALPILRIYFLGHKLEHTKAPVLRVNRVYVDAATGEQVHEKETLIESLDESSYKIGGSISLIPTEQGHYGRSISGWARRLLPEAATSGIQKWRVTPYLRIP